MSDLQIPKNYFPVKRRTAKLQLEIAIVIDKVDKEFNGTLTEIEISSALSKALADSIGYGLKDLIEGDEEIYENKD